MNGSELSGWAVKRSRLLAAALTLAAGCGRAAPSNSGSSPFEARPARHGGSPTAMHKGLDEPTNAGRISSTTNFDLTESALSEGGAWRTGIDPLQTPVSVASGIAFGTQTGWEAASRNYNDSEAWLAGTFPPNQRVSAVIHKAPGLSGGYQEVEILLRWSVGPLRTGLPSGDTHSYGYEINLAWDGEYSCIAQFKGTAMFDSLASGSPVTALGVHDGDVFTGEIVGNTVTALLTRQGVTTVLGTATDDSDSPVTEGTPGIGFFRGTSPGSTTNPQSFGFSSFTATAL